MTVLAAPALAACGAVAVLFGLPAAGVATHESLTSFATAACRFHTNGGEAELGANEPEFPFVRDLVLAAVRYPFKLEVHDSAQQEHLYDLSRDPDEERELLGMPSLANETAQLRETIAGIRQSQAVLRAKRAWPGGTGQAKLSN